MSDGLSCECRMPLLWQAATFDPAAGQSLIHQAAVLLSALNQIESMHEQEAGSPENRRLDRIEAKLDLTLLLLARTLENGSPTGSKIVQLSPAEACWPDPEPPAEGTALIVEFRPSEALPLNLKIPAIALKPEAGHARVSFAGLGEALDEALYQFVFRRHRQAIRARTV